jgi:hypothetical protein
MINKKLDEILNTQKDIAVELAIYNEQLKQHMRRTELLESEVKPLKEHVIRVQNIFWFLTTTIGIIISLKLLVK